MKIMIENEINEDIKILFKQYVEKTNRTAYVNAWELLHHAKTEDLFSREYFRMWFIKFLSIEDERGLFVLNHPTIVFTICEFNEKSLGEFLMPRIEFSLQFTGHSKFMSCIKNCLEIGVYFDHHWLKKQIDEKALFELEDSLEINKKNEVKFLQKTLPINSVTTNCILKV